MVEITGMDDGPSRLVRRIQRQLKSLGSDGASGDVAWCDVEELQARVRDLQDLDDRFTHVGLSRYVTQASMTREPGRVGGLCVATEV